MNKHGIRLLERTEFRENVLKFGETLPKRLKGLRKAIGYTQENVESDTGLDRNTLSRIEKGNVVPSIYSLIVLADYYGVSLDWLCGRDGYND